MKSAVDIAKLSGKVDIAANVLSIGSNIGSTLAAMSDAKKRAEFEKNLAYLSSEQKNALERDIARAGTLTQRIAILTNAMTMIHVQAVRSKLEKKPEDNTKQLLMIIGGGFAILIAAVIIKMTMK